MTMDKIEVYHASTVRIEYPDCKFGRERLDFGHGFYLTDIYEQAQKFAQAKARLRNQNPIINSYILDKKGLLQNGRVKIFENYDSDWLEYIADCRNGGSMSFEYDYVEGGVADDRVIDTVNMYIQGFITQERALANLRYLKPNNQICIMNQELLNKYLKFNDCIRL